MRLHMLAVDHIQSYISWTKRPNSGRFMSRWGIPLFSYKLCIRCHPKSSPLGQDTWPMWIVMTRVCAYFRKEKWKVMHYSFMGIQDSHQTLSWLDKILVASYTLPKVTKIVEINAMTLRCIFDWFWSPSDSNTSTHPLLSDDDCIRKTLPLEIHSHGIHVQDDQPISAKENNFALR